MGEYELLSLDLWDTVIRRKCHPDAIKQATSEYFLLNSFEYILNDFRSVQKLTEKRIESERILGEEVKKQGLDDEYEIHAVFEKWISEVAPGLKDRNSKIAELYNFELQQEISNAYLDPTILSEIQKYQYKNLAYVSDFYAGTQFIDSILKAINCPITFSKKFISCECGYNKRSGRLFDYVLKECGITASQQLHIGDNAYSDVQIPDNKGITAVRYIPETENKLRQERELAYKAHLQQMAYQIPYRNLKAIDNVSIFFYGFTKWIFESCKRENIKKIYFFTREGEFYKQIYDSLVRARDSDKNIPESEILEVSRIATFCPSLREISLKELMRIWNQYSIQALSALFKSLAIKKEEVISYIEKYNLVWDEVLTYPWQDERVIKLFDDKDFVKILETIRNDKKSLILSYFSEKGLDVNSSEKIAIVDIGWRGTIQDNICYLLPNKTIKGFYIGLLPVLNEQPNNASKFGYLNGYEYFDQLLRYVSPFEMICNSPNGSTVGYTHKAGRTIAIRQKEEAEDNVFYTHIENIQKQVLADIPILEKAIGNSLYITSSIRNEGNKVLFNFIMYPSKKIADAFFSLKHNEEFGVGEYVDKTTKFPFFMFVKGFLFKKYRPKVFDFLRNTTWPQGYFAKYGLRMLIKIYNRKTGV